MSFTICFRSLSLSTDRYFIFLFALLNLSVKIFTTMKRVIVCGVFFFLLLSFHLHGQLLKELGNKAKSLATKENLEKAGSAVFKGMEKARAAFDSADFDYAILLSDNSGLFDVKDKGEDFAKLTSGLSYFSALNKNEELAVEEKARFYREYGEVLYGSRKFNWSEKNFITAKKTYEDGGLKDNIGYIKTIANQGLLYNTMGRFTQSEQFTAEALDLRKTKFGENNIGVAASLNNY